MKLSFSNPFALKGSEKKIIKAIDRLAIDRSDNLSFLDPAAVRVAAAPIKLRPYRKLDDFVEHLNEKMAAAVGGGAQLVCFPELIGLAPITLSPHYARLLSDYRACPAKERGQLVNDALYDHYDYLQETYFTSFSELACQYGVYVLAGSLYLFEGDRLYNRAYLFDPDGDVVAYQDKLNPTRDELEFGVDAGEALTLMQTRIGNLCVAIGQDNCYFEIYRIARGLGAKLMLAPVCNLNFGCRLPHAADVYLRVQETPLYAVKSALTGDLMQRHFGGVSGVYAPIPTAADKQGLLAASGNEVERPLACRVNLNKLDAVFDPFSCDDNPEFLSAFAARHYDAADAAPAGGEDEL